MNNTQFFRLCEEIRNRREVLLQTAPTLAECAAEMSQRLGFAITERSIRAAKKAVGIDWKKAPAKPGKSTKSYAYRTVAISLHRLYKKLGEEIPSSLETLVQAIREKDGHKSPDEPQANGQAAPPTPRDVLPYLFAVGDRVVVDGRGPTVTITKMVDYHTVCLSDNTVVQTSRLKVMRPAAESRV